MKSLLVLILVLAVACSQVTPVSTPMWSEAEAVAVLKDWCQGGSYGSMQVSVCDRELSLWLNKKWSASYQQVDKRWVVTVEGESLFGSRNPDPIVSYVYENTQTVEWYVNR